MYENALIVVLIFGITWIMFLYWNKSQEGLDNNSGCSKEILTDYLKKTYVNDNYISKENIIQDFISKQELNSSYKPNTSVEKDYTSNYLVNRDYVDKKIYNVVNDAIINEQQKKNEILNNVLFSSNGNSVKMHIAEEENVYDLNNNPTLTNAKVSFENTLVIYFDDAPNCLELKNKDIRLSQGDIVKPYIFSDYSKPVCDLSFNKGPYKLELIS